MKRLCFVCLLIMMLSVFGGALALQEGDWQYSTYSDGTYITKYLGSDKDVIIPSEIGGQKIIGIRSQAFYNCSSLTSIVIPEGVTSIGNGAFRYCSSLTNIEIPEGVTSIGDDAFRYCSSLMSIKIPESVTSIGNWTFYNCSNFTRIEIPEGVTSIGNSTFYNCSSLTSIEIPGSVKSIGEQAFRDCTSLTDVDIQKSVTSIGDFAFSGCSSLMSIEIPESVTSIGNYVFYNCSGLISIEIPESVTSIGDSTFYDCSSLTEVDLPDGITAVGSGAFSGCNAKLYCSIGSDTAYALSKAGCSFRVKGNDKLSLQYEYDRDKNEFGGLKVIGADKDITEATIPEDVTDIGSGAFRDCTSLTSVEIPEGVTSIGNSAFYNCSSLTSIAIPEGVKSIGDWAFNNCSSLMEVDLPDGITFVGSGAFSGCNAKRYCRIGSDTAYALSKAGYSFRDRGNKKLSLRYEYEQNEITGLKVIDADKDITEAALPDSVTSIGNYAFKNCSGLISIEIPDGLRGIGDGAFHHCSSLTSIEIPESVTSIGESAFDDCSSLTSIEIPESVTSINDRAFDNCGLKTISIPEGVQSIGHSALRCSTLTKVFLPISVQQIGDTPFYYWITTVYCYEYSYAESWARDNGYTVVLIDEKPFSEIGSIDVRNKIYVANGVNTRVKADIFPLLPEITVNWTSSDPEIFTVKDGVITGRKNGTATLTITAGDLSVTSEVTVVTAAEDFTLEDIYVPAKGTAEAIVTGIVPADATLDIEWSTKDSVIASVTEEGLVTGKVLGDTMLTVVDRVTGRKRTATVYIIGPIKRVELDRISAELLPFEGLQLNATAYTDERSFMNQQLTFASDNEAVAVVNQRGFVQAKGAGTATITATAGSRAKASCQITVREAAIMLIPASATEIADGAFEGTGAELYVIPETTKTIGARAFADMKKARVIVLPEGIEADPTAFDGTDATFIRPDGTAVQ